MPHFMSYIRRMKANLTKAQWIFMGAAVLVTMLVRLVEHPFNFTPVAGLALLGAAYMSKRWLAWILPIAAFWVTDLVLNNVIYAAYFDGFVFTSTPFLFSAAAILLMVVVGKKLLKNVKTTNLVLASLIASTIFFLVSNFGVLFNEPSLYPKTMSGYLTSLGMGLPFFRTAIFGDLLFSGVLFGAWHLLFERSHSAQVSRKEA